jgi:hypothetical protein
MTKYLQLWAGLMALFWAADVKAAQPLVLQTDEVAVIYEPSLDHAAGEVARIYPTLRQSLEELFGWRFDIRPQVVLVAANRNFRQLSRDEHIVAYAVPDKNLIVIDYSRMNIQPFTLNTTLKHELCHLMLHRHIADRNLPRWLDEGVCQWVSDGIGEILINKDWSGLDAAVMAGRIIPFKRLSEYFPRDELSLILAYEQSKSVVNYLDRQYGYRAILEILDSLKSGRTLESALMNRLGILPAQLEDAWLDHLASTPRWLVFLANHLYGILFFLAAVLTMFGYVRHRRRRKKIYEQWEEEEW